MTLENQQLTEELEEKMELAMEAISNSPHLNSKLDIIIWLLFKKLVSEDLLTAQEFDTITEMFKKISSDKLSPVSQNA